MPGCQICIYTLPINCSVSTENFSVTERIPKLTDFEADGSNTTTYPINLALVQKFMSESELEQYDGNTFSNIPPIVKLPKFKFFEHDLDQQLATDKNAPTLTVLQLLQKMMLSFLTHWENQLFQEWST